MPVTDHRLVFKIVGDADWKAAERNGEYAGSSDDRRDGFIHLSTASQVAGTLERHFSGRGDLVIVAVDVRPLGLALRYEPSRGGALFPHLYGVLRLAAVAWAARLPLGPDGHHVIPGGVA